jgi:hypothetical protein
MIGIERCLISRVLGHPRDITRGSSGEKLAAMTGIVHAAESKGGG